MKNEQLIETGRTCLQIGVLMGMVVGVLNGFAHLNLIPYILPYGSFAETHIGNLPLSAVLTALIKKESLEKGETESFASFKAILGVTLINSGGEALLGLISDFSEWSGDVGVGILTAILVAIATYDGHAQQHLA